MSGFPGISVSGRHYLEGDKTCYIDRASNGGTDDVKIVSPKITGGAFLSNVARQTVTKLFPHQAAVTTSGEERLWYNDSGVTWTVHRVDVQADYRGGTSGSTVVKINTDGVGGSSSNIQTTLSYNQNRITKSDSTVDISDGSVLYIFITTADGGHEDVEVTLYLRAC